MADELYPLSADALCLGTTAFSWTDDPQELEPGTIAKVRFPVMFRLDRKTPDGRYIAADGFSMRPGPWSLMYQDRVQPQHDDARLVGSLREVTVVDNVGSGWGFLADLPAGHEAKVALQTRSIRGVSADLVSVKRDLPTEELAALGVREVASQSTFARATLVTVPAFPDAYGELDGELVASARYYTDSVVARPDSWFEDPRLSGPTAVRIVGDEVFGHIWSRTAPCHRSFADRCEMPPLDDDFGDFHKAHSVLLESGAYAATGRVFFVTTHQRGLAGATSEQINLAYDHTGMCWADVRAGYDRFGIWIHGALRPGLGQSARYAIQASPLSGHWSPSLRPGRRGKRSLQCCLSVNSEGFTIDEDVDGTLVASGPPPGALILSTPIEPFAVAVTEHELEDHTIDGEPATGAMIALLPDEPDQLVVEGGEPVDALHVTLRYLGDADAWADEARNELAGMVAEWADKAQGGVRFTVSGVGELGDNGAGVLILNGAVEGLQSVVAGAAEHVAGQHGIDIPADYPNFVPHMTLRWDGQAPPSDMIGREIHCSTLRVVFADMATDFDLATPQPMVDGGQPTAMAAKSPRPLIPKVIDTFGTVFVNHYARRGRTVTGHHRSTPEPAAVDAETVDGDPLAEPADS